MDTLIATSSFLSQPTYALPWTWRKSWYSHSRADWVNLLSKQTNSALWSADVHLALPLRIQLTPRTWSVSLSLSVPKHILAETWRVLVTSSWEKNRIFSLHWGNNHERICRDSLFSISHPSAISTGEHIFCSCYSIDSSEKKSLKKGGRRQRNYLKSRKLCFPLFPPIISSF